MIHHCNNTSKVQRGVHCLCAGSAVCSCPRVAIEPLLRQGQENVYVTTNGHFMNLIRLRKPEREQLHSASICRGLSSGAERAAWRAPVPYRWRLMRALHPVTVNFTPLNLSLRQRERSRQPSRHVQGAYLQLHLNRFGW